MKYIKQALSAFLVLFLALSALSVQAQIMLSEEQTDIEIQLSVNQVAAGSEFKAAILLNIKDMWHINAHNPGPDYLIGAEINIEPHDQFILSDIRYPESEKYEFDFSQDEEIYVYEGLAPIFASFRAPESLESGDYTIERTLTIQACSDKVCLSPSSVPIKFSITGLEENAVVDLQHEDLFARYDAASPVSVSVNNIADLLNNQSGWVIFGSIFLMGLLLNLTPCVYPMLSVTVSIFGAQTETRSRTVFLKALTYVLGIATMYSLLGVAAAFSGGLFGAWLQSPLMLSVIAVLFLLLSLSMFGLYELQLPYWVTQRLGGNGTAGFAGVYFSGLVVGIFAAPCIGPPIIALLTFVGAQADPLFGFWSFFTLSLGLGLPYLILGTFSGLLQKLPKSGLWMVWVKKLFGVVLVGLALFYAGLAFFPAYVLCVIPVTLVTGGIYLGFTDRTGPGKSYFRIIKYGTGIAAIVFGLTFTLNLQNEGMEWEEYSQERFEQAVEDGEPVMMDFYADWCIPCLELERKTFTDAGVIAASDGLARLKVDLTRFDSPEAEALRKQYHVAGVPTIVFINPQGEEAEDARVVGFMNAEKFLKQIEKVE